MPCLRWVVWRVCGGLYGVSAVGCMACLRSTPSYQGSSDSGPNYQSTSTLERGNSQHTMMEVINCLYF